MTREKCNFIGLIVAFALAAIVMVVAGITAVRAPARTCAPKAQVGFTILKPSSTCLPSIYQ